MKAKQSAIINANKLVNNTYGEWAKSRKIRDTNYTDLNDRLLRVKEAVKSQFGVGSLEYGLIKGIKV